MFEESYSKTNVAWGLGKVRARNEGRVRKGNGEVYAM